MENPQWIHEFIDDIPTKATMGLEERNDDHFVGTDLLYERMMFEIRICLNPNQAGFLV